MLAYFTCVQALIRFLLKQIQRMFSERQSVLLYCYSISASFGQQQTPIISFPKSVCFSRAPVLFVQFPGRSIPSSCENQYARHPVLFVCLRSIDPFHCKIIVGSQDQRELTLIRREDQSLSFVNTESITTKSNFEYHLLSKEAAICFLLRYTFFRQKLRLISVMHLDMAVSPEIFETTPLCCHQLAFFFSLRRFSFFLTCFTDHFH